MNIVSLHAIDALALRLRINREPVPSLPNMDSPNRRNDDLIAANKALSECTAFLKGLVDSSYDCIKVLSFEGTIEFINAGGGRVLEADNVDALIGLRWLDFWPEVDRALAIEAMAKATSGGMGRFRGFRPTMKGSVRWWDVQITPILGADGKPEKLLAVSRDITEHRQAEEHQTLLKNELQHRVKNTLAVVQVLAAQTFGKAASRETHDAFAGRLAALAIAHTVLTESNWESATLGAIIGDVVATYEPIGGKRIRGTGPIVLASPKPAIAIAMAIHELATNAVKYGALSTAEGHVDIAWTAENGRFKLRWEEHGGPTVIVPARRGFGSKLVQQALAMELEGVVEIDFHPTGVVCTIDSPLSTICG